MTTSMWITLAIVVLMIVLIISDKLPFGAPALLAAVLLVVTGQGDMATAFKGFTDKNVVMIMGFMACMVALQKTELIFKLKKYLAKLATKGGIGGLVALIIGIMAIGNFITGTAFYMLVLTLVSTIPYNKKLPNSKILLPAVMATCASSWLPTGVVFFVGLVSSLTESAGYTGSVDINTMAVCGMNIVFSVIYLIYAIIMHKFLPDHDIQENADVEAAKEEENTEFVPVLSKTQEKIVYVLYAILIVTLLNLSKFPNEIGYGIPVLIAILFMVFKIYDFKTLLGNMFSPVMIMMASVIGVAEAMANSGLSSVIGAKIATLLGTNPSLFVLVLVFALMTSLMATFTGASFGSLFIFAPIGIPLCIQYGYSPVPLAFACVLAAWINFFMPIDGMPALTMGMGKYKITTFWMYTIPLWIIKMLTVCIFATTFLA